MASDATSSARSRGQTRERILDVAQELFIAQGYDGTSLRDIAERLGVTKAALYYHFERKEDIFLALHLRLHALGREAFEELAALPDGAAIAEAWPAFLDRFIGLTVQDRDLFLLHARNRSALEEVQHSPEHQAEQQDLEQAVRRTLAHPDLTLDQRVRMTCSMAAALGGMMGGEELFGDASPEEVAEHVRAAVRDLTAGL